MFIVDCLIYLTKCIFTSISNIQKAIFIFMFSINLTHCRTKVKKLLTLFIEICLPWLRNCFVNKQKNCLFRCQLNSFTNNPHKLCNCYIIRYQKFSFINIRYLRFWYTFNNNLKTTTINKNKYWEIDLPEFVQGI